MDSRRRVLAALARRPAIRFLPHVRFRFALDCVRRYSV